MSETTKIVHRHTGTTLYEGEGDLRAAIEAAVGSKADLRGAYLRGACLTGAYLRGAYLTGACLRGAHLRGSDLTGADLTGADLRGAYLRGAYLTGACLRGAHLRGSDLTGADLTGADLRGAYLRGAYLTGACLRGAHLRGSDLTGAHLRGAKGWWQLHDVLAEILFRAAGDSVERRKIAGLIAISTDWCWDQFLAMDDPEKDWALDVLAASASADDPTVPDVVRARMPRVQGPPR